MSKYPEYKNLNLSQIGKDVLQFWKEEKIFEKSVESRPASKPYTFFVGPPSANGLPGIHHVMARSIKDIFCRYKTLQGYNSILLFKHINMCIQDRFHFRAATTTTHTGTC